MHSLLPREAPRFTLPPLAAGKRGLVLGMGGGCDVIGALAVAKLWKEQSQPDAAVLYGNCVSPREFPEDFKALGEFLWMCSPNVVELQQGDQAYGTTRLEQSLPRCSEGSPFVFVVPHDGRDGMSLEEATKKNTRALCESLEALRVDSVVGVDLGGDSLTGGFDFHGDAEFGRDRQVLHALRASNVPCVHLVVAPGCDGESTIEGMRAAVRELDEAGALLGTMPLDEMVGTMRSHAANLSPMRTPNIIHSAFGRVNSASSDDGAAASPEMFRIVRHNQEAHIPCSWLTIALAIDLHPRTP
ncbi:hypothetical protein AB1Y20_019631 [Prymnesium parvum]|uniref:DUF1152 domain-containing protein n=1 Tax=Prymnesium parvum TaxID=97485 RepID=A0AB34JRL9_PRYPA